MTKKQDLIIEAKSLGIEITSKDTIPILCQKIQIAGGQSSNCPSAIPKKRGRPAKNSPKLIKQNSTKLAKIKTSPKIKRQNTTKLPKIKTSPKIKKQNSARLLKVNSTKLPKIKVNSPKPSKTPKSPKSKIPKNTIILTFPELEGDNMIIKLESDSEISQRGVIGRLNYIKDLMDSKILILKDENQMRMKDGDLRGSSYSVIQKPKKVKQFKTRANYSGVEEYQNMKGLKFMGMTNTNLATKGMTGFSIRLMNLYFSSAKEFYVLKLELKVPYYAGTDMQDSPIVFKSSFDKVTKTIIDQQLYSTDEYSSTKIFINNTKNGIEFYGYDGYEDGNFRINLGTEDFISFFELPKFIKFPKY